MPRIDFAALGREIDRLGQQQMDATLGVLAKGLPIFDAASGAGDEQLVGRVPA